MAKVSINLCCYNSEEYLEQTLGSIWSQTFRDYEVVIVNDGSIDRTDKIVRSHMAQGRPISYYWQSNSGLGSARNHALKRSSGDFIAILDHDDIWEPSKLERQMQLFERPEVGFAGCDAVFINSNGRTIGRYSDHHGMSRGRILTDLFLWNFIPCAGVVFRRHAIAQAGGFFRSDFHVAEEYELFLRLAEHVEYDFIPEALVRIRVHRKSAGWDVRRERAEMRQAYEDVLERNPMLAESLGDRVLRVKRAGFWLSRQMADALSGHPSDPAVKAKAALVYAASLMGPAACDRLFSLKRGLKRRLA